mgnify:CR=1 FL=1
MKALIKYHYELKTLQHKNTPYHETDSYYDNSTNCSANLYHKETVVPMLFDQIK